MKKLMKNKKGFINWALMASPAVIGAIMILIVLGPVIFGAWAITFKMWDLMFSEGPGGFPVWAIVVLGFVALYFWRRRI